LAVLPSQTMWMLMARKDSSNCNTEFMVEKANLA
jgi:hypothetical protein